MRFTAMLWQEVESIHRAIIEHPFNRELTDGSLSRERFEFYIQQDALYLADFGRALAVIGSRSASPARMLDFVRFAEGAVVVERALHEEYFQLFGVRNPTVIQSPSCFAYTNFLIATAAQRSYEEGVAALLPCFWIYQAVGRHIHACASAHNPYQKWIDTYAGEEFGRLVDKAIKITDEVADRASPGGRGAMKEAFVTSSRLEWMFWDSAYRMERWGPALGQTVQ
jgi:thiaminase (transcriptional activator TenA)